jgi:hypothetical protein
VTDYLPPLTWFEVQVCPRDFRIGFVPGQPILLGAAGRETVLLSPEQDPAACAAVVAALDEAVRRHHILEEPVRQPDRCFEDAAAMAAPSLHLRLAYGGASLIEVLQSTSERGWIVPL